MTCREIQPSLARLADCDGAPRIALEAARHLAGCMDCAATLLRLRHINTTLDLLPSVEVPKTFSERVLKVLPRRARQAGAALLLALLALAGVAASLGSTGASLWVRFQAPLDSATLALSSLASALRAFADVIRTAIDAAPVSIPRVPGGLALVSLPMALTAMFAGLVLAAAAAAIGGGILGRRVARRGTGHPLS